MSTPKENFAEHILQVDEDQTTQYVHLRHEARMYMSSCDLTPTGGMGDFYMHVWTKNDFINAIKSSNKSVKVAVADSMAWADRCWLYRENEQKRNGQKLIEDSPSEIRDQVEASVDLVSRIVTVTSGNFTEISIDRLALRNDKLRKKPGETVAILGLNGVGKTTTINSIKSFCSTLDLKMNHVKFPRQVSPVSALINDIASGRVEIDSAARQLIFAADLLDYWNRNPSQADIDLTDRLPGIDGMVYPDGDTAKLLSLVTLEAATNPVIPLIIERNPRVCLEAVRARNTPSRIYERKLEQMALQSANLVALSDIPGARVVNADGLNLETSKFYAGANVVDATISSGVYTRALVHNKKFKNYGQADQYIRKMGWEWYFKQRKNSKIKL